MRGAPYSICFTGHLNDDSFLLAIAGAWQAAGKHHLRHPLLPKKGNER